MIRVTFDLLPGADATRARTIGIMEVTNIGAHLDGTADYAVALKKTPPFAGALRLAWKNMLPRWWRRIESAWPPNKGFEASLSDECGCYGYAHMENAPTEPLALCAVLFAALIPQEKEPSK